MILYHITPRINLPSIMIQGLILNYEKGLNCSGKSDSVVWLTNDPLEILTDQAGIKWIKKNDPIILKVNVKELNIFPYQYASGLLSTFEYCYNGIIPSDRISLLHQKKHLVSK